MKVSKLKLLKASQVAKFLMYARQHYFEHRDNPNKILARRLAQALPKIFAPEIMVSN